MGNTSKNLGKFENLQINKKHFNVFISDRDIEAVCRLCPDFKGDWTNLEDVKKFILFYFLSAR